MIIKKSRFRLTPGFSAVDWPFNVSEVAVTMLNVNAISGDPDSRMVTCWSIVHDFGQFALSGLLESYGFQNLKDAGIWADLHGYQPGLKKSLAPFFKYLEFLVKG